jgi:hypothetical protein
VLVVHSVRSLLTQRAEVEFLRDPQDCFLSRFAAGGSSEVDSGNQSDPNIVVLHIFDQPDVSTVGSRVLDPDPLLQTQLTVFCFVVFVNLRHLLGWHQDVLVQNKVKALACLSHVDIFEGFYKYIPFSLI